ncbi:hypothetical protein AB0L59_02295 [Streptomyces sp. NPDC052109]|uniref:hypothetical protein n=1 Tax=Streptomyces sp. NPDC052109 TaxID=3155527 RepID=UPI003427701F
MRRAVRRPAAGPSIDPDLPRPSACDLLPPHAALLFFTDGLIERRGEPLDDVMTRLRPHPAVG